MRVIWKYLLEMVPLQSIQMPAGAQILHVDFQEKTLCLWAGVKPSEPMKFRTIQIVGTGHTEVPDEGVWHLGTVQQGAYVWHVFELDRGPSE